MHPPFCKDPAHHKAAMLTLPRQVSPNATEQELKKAYKTGALKHHPGMFPVFAHCLCCRR